MKLYKKGLGGDIIISIILSIIIFHIISGLFTTVVYREKTDKLCFENGYEKAYDLSGIFPYTRLKYALCSNPVVIDIPGVTPVITYTKPVKIYFTNN